jgi:hypothetical protein
MATWSIRIALFSGHALRIVDLRPLLVLVAYSFADGEPNPTDKVLQQFKDAGIKVFTYTRAKYGKHSIDQVKPDIVV